jgi:hypothetical protein
LQAFPSSDIIDFSFFPGILMNSFSFSSSYLDNIYQWAKQLAFNQQRITNELPLNISNLAPNFIVSLIAITTTYFS